MSEDRASRDAVMIERTFDAPAALVWQMWTEPHHFEAWYGPDGVTISVAAMDVRVGGRRLVSMTMETPGGPMQMWFGGEHREVVLNRRLVFTEFMSDHEGSVVSPQVMGMPEGHPAITQVIVELEEVGGKTKMVLTHIGIPADSPGATGWAMAFNKLAVYIEHQRAL